MKKININLFSLFFSFFLFANCGSKHKATAEKSNSSAAATAPRAITVSGTVTQTNSYCGGARPTDEILAQIQKSRPYPGKKFHVIKGEKNTAGREIVLSFTTDSAGNFSFKLPAGNYSILLDEQIAMPDAKKYTSQFVKADEACFKEWWEKPYYLLEIPETTNNTSIKGLNFEFHHRCFIGYDIPCLQYDGPMPP